MDGDIHDAEQLPCLLNHSAGEQSEETALVPLGGSPFSCLLLAAEQLGEETGFNWIVCVALATIFLRYTLQGLFNMVSTTAPSWLSALTTRCSAAHSFLLSELGLVVRG